jgi:hypothetical protein
MNSLPDEKTNTSELRNRGGVLGSVSNHSASKPSWSAEISRNRIRSTFLNRDHIILVTIDHGEIIVTTTAGTRITIPASAATLAKFVDNFANHFESNLVSIAATPVAAH